MSDFKELQREYGKEGLYLVSCYRYVGDRPKETPELTMEHHPEKEICILLVGGNSSNDAAQRAMANVPEIAERCDKARVIDFIPIPLLEKAEPWNPLRYDPEQASGIAQLTKDGYFPLIRIEQAKAVFHKAKQAISDGKEFRRV